MTINSKLSSLCLHRVTCMQSLIVVYRKLNQMAACPAEQQTKKINLYEKWFHIKISRTSVMKNIAGTINQMAIGIILYGWCFQCLFISIRHHHHHHHHTRRTMIWISVPIRKWSSISHHQFVSSITFQLICGIFLFVSNSNFAFV